MKEDQFPTASAEHQIPIKAQPPQQHGVLVLDKPGGMSSASCIARVKHQLGQKKIGHAGTLDPMATGVLIVLLGNGTKISGHLMDDGDKTYSGSIRLGVVTDTWDAEGRELERRPVEGVDAGALAKAFSPLIGTYEQEVPAYSAAKHQGKPLYALARKGLETPVKKKFVTISRGEAELVGFDRVRFRVTCSSGTYIRSLAHSLGNRLGCGATLEELTREYSHPFGIDAAHNLDAVIGDPEGFPQRVLGIAEALPGWPKLRISRDEVAAVRNGSRLAYVSDRLAMLPFMPGIKALMVDESGTAVALAETVLDAGGKEAWGVMRGLWN